jgi:nicotinate-nucleotide adenylyltransferase
MRIGVFGGTFDPVHQGHLILAEQCREQALLDQVWFVPAPRPPQKPELAISRFDQRVEMLQLAVAGNPAFRIDEIEKDRPGPSYTADTLPELKRQHPGETFLLLIGADSLADLHAWYQPLEVVKQAGLLVMMRPGYTVPTPEVMRQRLQAGPEIVLDMQVVQAPLIEVSSRDLRRRVAEGRSIRYFVPRAVECYIQEKGLYRPS